MKTLTMLCATLISCAAVASDTGVGATQLRAGQVWAYKNRPDEQGSTLTILKVEKYPDLGEVVHIRVDGIHMPNPLKGNIISDIPHLPFKELAIKQSITHLVRTSIPVPDFRGGYDTWRKAHDAGEAGAFDTPVKQTLNAMLGGKWEEKK
ncbi:hypothetical protein [Paraburkholderia caribensis]|uniref:hypothetical protein n=1 Tax=Paraburkholderia caribensis TaxID=75105 RepID=UPI0028602461|nr:hypothetical protein [Paraburkholderia caribensis]MDR6385102.1 hypothetical protein [Paraburkholderia caribensis]